MRNEKRKMRDWFAMYGILLVSFQFHGEANNLSISTKKSIRFGEKSLGTRASCLREAGWKPANPGAGKMSAFPEVPSISLHCKWCVQIFLRI